MFDRPIARIAVYMLMDLSAQRIIRSTKNRRKSVCRSYDPQPFEQVVKALSVEVEVVNSYAARKLSPIPLRNGWGRTIGPNQILNLIPIAGVGWMELQQVDCHFGQILISEGSKTRTHSISL